MTTVIQAFSTNDYQNAGTYQNVYCSAVSSGNSLVLILRVPNAQLPLTTTPETWNGSVAVSMGTAITSNTDVAGMTRYVYKLDNITNGANRVRWKTSATGQCASDVFELGTAGASLTLGVDQRTTYSYATSQSVGFTNPVANSTALVTLDMFGSGPSVTPDAPYLKATHGNYNVDTIYNADIGAAGSKTAGWTFSASSSGAAWVLTFSTASPGPTVSTVTIGSVTEGGAASVTVALSGATSASTDFACGLAGVTATGADLTMSLNGVTCTNGVTCDGSNFTVPSGVSDWSFNVQTTADTLDEANETATITIGGQTATITITDDDAAPEVSVSDATETAGEVVFTVSLSAVSGKTITVDYATANGTSTAGVDYTAATGTLTFAAGETTKTVTVTVP